MGDAAAQLQVLALVLERLEELRPYPEGLFRVAGPRDEVHELAASLLRDDPIAAREALTACRDPYTCADALKQWLRARLLLPTAGEVRQTMEAAAAATAAGRATAVRAWTADTARTAHAELVQTLSTLPPLSQAVVAALLPLLRNVIRSAATAMQPRSLAICLAPSLFDGSRTSGQHDRGTQEERQQANAADIEILHCLLFDPAPKPAFDDTKPLVLSEVVRAGPGPLRELLRSGRLEDVNTTLEDKWTLLHWAARLGAQNCAKLLMEHGADVTIGDWGKYNALHVAATVEVTEVLLHCRNACAALWLRNKAGRTAFEEHAEEGRTGVAEMLRRAEPRMVEARRQRLAWAKAGIHRRLATTSVADTFSPPFQWLSDDLVSEVGRRIPLIFRQTPADIAAVAAADPRLLSAQSPREPVMPSASERQRQNCAVQ